MTRNQQQPGAICAEQRVWLHNDPLVTDIEERDGRIHGIRECSWCGRPGVAVVRSLRVKGGHGRWLYAEHIVPDRAPRAYVAPKPRIDEAAFAAALEECASQEEMAHRLGVNLRTVQRAFDRYRPGSRPNRRDARTTKHHRRRIRHLARCGAPATWIAEELPFTYDTVLDHARTVPGYAEEVSEWRRVWPSIRNNPTLLALHYEFAPKREGHRGHDARENRDHPGVRRVEAGA